MPIAVVISSLPIVLKALEDALSDYSVRALSWDAFPGDGLTDADLIVADTTRMARRRALSRLAPYAMEARLALFSLHGNEVDVYRAEQGELEIESSLPNLNCLTAWALT